MLTMTNVNTFKVLYITQSDIDDETMDNIVWANTTNNTEVRCEYDATTSTLQVYTNKAIPKTSLTAIANELKDWEKMQQMLLNLL
jgi:hypothetical protein